MTGDRVVQAVGREVVSGDHHAIERAAVVTADREPLADGLELRVMTP